MTALLAAARAIHFASLMAIFGGSAYVVLLRRAGLWGSPPKASRLLFATSAALAILSGTFWFCLIAGEMSGSWRGSLDPAVLQLAATDTRFGHIFLGRMVGLIALCLLCSFKMESTTVVALLAGLLLASLGPVSHAAAGGDNVVTTGAVSDAVHLLAGGFWLGGLLVLASLVARRELAPMELVAALGVFSSWGGSVVALLVLTGVINLLVIMPLSAMSLRNSYFDLLLAKVALAAAMIALAALNRWRFAPALRTGGGTQRLAASVGSEIVLGFAVIAIAGLLGLTAPH